MVEDRPFHHYIVKIASRCNLNCTYCHIYNHSDTGWKRQPAFINIATFEKFCERVLEHCRAYNKKSVRIILHGGEPLLAGAKRLSQMASIAKDILLANNISATLSLQSNGLLFTDIIGRCLRKNNISIGISIDGPPQVNDLYRVDHRGNGQSKLLEKNINILSSGYKDVFSGFLTVVNPTIDPMAVIKYLLSFNPRSIDLLLPHHNYENLPLQKRANFSDTVYADWLIAVYDYWLHSGADTSIRYFESIIRLILGGRTLVETIGNPDVDAIVVESNGEIEMDDNLRSTYDGMTRLGYNLFENSFNEIAGTESFRMRRSGNNTLSAKCQACYLVQVCGGGNLPHRYSAEKHFDNPSVYCADLEKLILHIKASVESNLPHSKIALGNTG
jgi:uncharacterized protein